MQGLIPEGPPAVWQDWDGRVRMLCVLFNGSITGGPRTVKRNQEVGGVDRSYHLWERDGLAADVVLDDMSEGMTSQFVTACKVFSIRALVEEDHIHLQPEVA